jgi:hypothetical protein
MGPKQVRSSDRVLQHGAYRVISRYMHRDTFIAKLTEVQQTVEQLLAQL